MKSARQRAPLPVRFEKRDERCSPEKKYTGSRARTGKGITVKFLFCAIESAILSSQAGAFHQGQSAYVIQSSKLHRFTAKKPNGFIY